ncbi:hypothetical protein [Rossellomorea marisflavi]|uniref:hypothetical protein n=2 Tax=Rossellomorea marisflavi TaxID=189381 RepID=UPI003516C496
MKRWIARKRSPLQMQTVQCSGCYPTQLDSTPHQSQATTAEEKVLLPSIPNEKVDYQIANTYPDAHSAAERNGILSHPSESKNTLLVLPLWKIQTRPYKQAQHSRFVPNHI